MSKTSLSEKGARLVMAGRVAITHRSDSTLNGFVKGSSGQLYHVTVDPAGYHCTCKYGEYNPGVQHSHTIALLLEDARARGQRGIEDVLAPYATEGEDT